MILPAQHNITSYVGSTYNTVLTLFQGDPAYQYKGLWNKLRTYTENSVVWVDGALYYAIQDVPANKQPSQETDYWAAVSNVDLTDWSGMAQIGTVDPLVLDDIPLGDAAGTVTLNLTADQTHRLGPGDHHFFVKLTTNTEEVYYPIRGTFKLISP